MATPNWQREIEQLVANKKLVEAAGQLRQATAASLTTAANTVAALASAQTSGLSTAPVWQALAQGTSPSVAIADARNALPEHRNAWMDEVLAQLNSGQKIEAIRTYRQHTGKGLKESKLAVDDLERALGREPAPVGCTTGAAKLLLVGTVLWRWYGGG